MEAKGKDEQQQLRITEREKDDLTQQANSVAIKAIGRKEGQPVLSPAPGCVIATMDEDQRWVLFRFSIPLIWVFLLGENLHFQTRWELVKRTALTLL